MANKKRPKDEPIPTDNQEETPAFPTDRVLTGDDARTIPQQGNEPTTPIDGRVRHWPEDDSNLESSILPTLPLPEVVIFPNSISPLFVVRPASLAAVEEAMTAGNRIFLVTQKSIHVEQPHPSDLYTVGTISQILQVQRLPDGSLRTFIEGQTVARVKHYVENDRMLSAEVEPVVFAATQNRRLLALIRAVLKQFEAYARLSDKIPEDLFLNIKHIDDPLNLAHAIANYAPFRTADKQDILEMTDVAEKFVHLSQVFTVENDLLGMERQILNQVKTQIGKNQKEYFLNEQLKAIEKELGLGSEEDIELEELQKAIDDSLMSDEARDKSERELSRLARMAPMSPEYTVSRTYIEWLLDFPWGRRTEDTVDLRRAMRILNEDHYGLEKIKERIVEYLAVLRLVKNMRGPILCLVGPPGVGKTSLARSIARTLNRKFVRFSLGGVRDEAEIRGHRRTYIGALPGKIVQMLKKADSENPVLLLDEVDKMNADFRGDPASALLEVLDPEQNVNFNDHYMEVDLDLSGVLFLTTANTTDGIPWALQDRMEIIRLPGYTRGEKIQIARQFLVPRKVQEHGLTDQQIAFGIEGLECIVDSYTREAGVRNLEREIAAICRKVARKIGSAHAPIQLPFEVGAKAVRTFLGPLRFKDLEIEQKPEIGITTGLAWTEVGGEILPVEATVMPGKGELQLTGKLGEVMRESARAGLSYIRAHAKTLGIDEEFHKKCDIHVHLPEGAIPKDGPSAGVTMITSMVSALSGKPVRQDVAMTGEITLRGKVIKIGGLKEKVIAAHRAHIRTIIIPADNAEDISEIAPEIRRELKFHRVTDIAEVLRLAIVDSTKDEKKKPDRPKPRKKASVASHRTVRSRAIAPKR
jgi:ATP-dependent Lon protease